MIPGLNPKAASALVRARDKLVGQIRKELESTPRRSIQGSLYVLLIAIANARTTTLKRQAQFRDLFNLIKGEEIDSVKKFAEALPMDVKLDEVIDGSTKSAIEVAKMLSTIAKIRESVRPTDHVNLEFYDRLKQQVENGAITEFGALCDRLPEFIVSEEMRRARSNYREDRELKQTAIANFRTKAMAQVKEDISFTAFGTVQNLVLKVLRDLVDDFCEPAELMESWKTLRDSAKVNRYTTVDNFLASLPQQLRAKATTIVATNLAQSKR
jgi:hypothetical protein